MTRDRQKLKAGRAYRSEYLSDNEHWSLESVSGMGRKSSVELQPFRPAVVILFDLLVVLTVAGFLCFYRIADVPFFMGDEAGHAKVVQEMHQSGDWMNLTKKGIPYYKKLPLKMWLTAAALSQFGESTYVYRAVDSAIALLFITSVFFFARSLFQSRTAAYFTLLTLACTKALFQSHGLRQSTQDTLLLLLSSVAIMTGWYGTRALLSAAPQGPVARRRLHLFAATFGLCIGLAFLTKAVAAVVPAAIIGLFLLFTGGLPKVFREGKSAAALALSIATIVPLLYIVPRQLHDPRFLKVLFGNEIWRRATLGFHNRHLPFFYFEMIFGDNLVLPPILIVLATIFAAYCVLRRNPSNDNRRSYLLLLIWSWTPIVIFSLCRSRLKWYVILSSPGFALMVGGLLAACAAEAAHLVRVGRFWPGGHSWPRSLVAAALLLASAPLLAPYMLSVFALVTEVRPPFPLMTLAERAHLVQKNGVPVGDVYSYRMVRKPIMGERLYLDMLHTKTIEHLEALYKRLSGGNVALVLTTPVEAAEIIECYPPLSYWYMPPLGHRKQWISALIYQRDLVTAGSTRSRLRIEASEIPEEWYGWGPDRTVQGRFVRDSEGGSSLIELAHDPVRKKLGGELQIVLGRAIPERPIKVTVALNGHPAGEILPPSEGFQAFRIPIAPDELRDGRNAIRLEYLDENSQPLGERSRGVLVSRIEFLLRARDASSQ